MSNFFKTMSSIKYTCLTALSLSLSCQVMAQTSPNGKIKAILDEGDEVEVEDKNGGKWIDLFSIDTKAMKVSKARKAFRDIVDERIARFYFIDGEKGAAKRIALDRSLVIWE